MVELFQLIKVIGTFLGAVLAVAFVLKITGLSSWVLAFVQQLFDIVKRTVQFVVDNLPKPIKIMMFFLLFAVIAPFIYNFTLGATSVCGGLGADAPVYKYSYFDGLLVTVLQDVTAIPSEPVENAQIDFLEIDTTISTNLLKQENVFNDFSGQNEVWTFALVALTDFSVIENLNIFQRLPNDVLFRQYFGGDQKAVYDICLDLTTSTCVLARADEPGLLFGNAVPQDACTKGKTAEWETKVGRINYLYTGFVGDDENSVITVSILDEIGGGFINRIGKRKIQSCGVADVDQDISQWGELNTMIYDKERTVTFLNVFGSNLPNHLEIPIYNSYYGAIWRTIADASSQIPKGTAFFNIQEQQLNTFFSDLKLLEERELLEQRSGDLFQFQCDEDTLNPFDTTMTVAGIDPFSPTMMIFFILIGLVIAVFGWFGVFK